MNLINNKKDLTCPDCWSNVDDTTKNDFIQGELQVKHNEFERQKMVDRDPNLHWCPKVNCNNYVCMQNPRGKKQKAICSCGFEFCINCHQPWHEKSK